MAATVGACILTFTTLWGCGVVAQDLGRPTNVRLVSYNMNLVLKWDPPDGANSSLVYTAEYRSAAGTYREGCDKISAWECEFNRTTMSGHVALFEYGKYTARVQAHLGSQSSDWVESNEISLDKHTIIGPPTVNLISSRGTLEVTIKDPVFAISTLRNVYSHHTYNITYWEDSQKVKAINISKIRQDRVVLDMLKPQTKYCVEVQIITLDSEPNPSERSKPVCESTKSEEGLPWATAVVSFFVIAIIIALVVLAVVYRRSISHFFCPKDTLPQHIKEYLLKPPSSTLYPELQESDLLEENYDPISIIADKRTVEEGGPIKVPGSPCSPQSDITI